MDKQFEKIPSTQHAINLLVKFENLNLPGLPIQEKYQRILSHYGKDIEMVSKIYQKNKNEPPVARDLPPIAGKIITMWCLNTLFHMMFPSFLCFLSREASAMYTIWQNAVCIICFVTTLICFVLI